MLHCHTTAENDAAVTPKLTANNKYFAISYKNTEYQEDKNK
jgi:hypothetical protein